VNGRDIPVGVTMISTADDLDPAGAQTVWVEEVGCGS
jgi:hypothetical protein